MRLNAYSNNFAELMFGHTNVQQCFNNSISLLDQSAVRVTIRVSTSYSSFQGALQYLNQWWQYD